MLSVRRKTGSRKAAPLLDAESGSLVSSQSLAFLVVRRKGGTMEGHCARNAVGPFFVPPQAPSVLSEGESYSLADLIISCIVRKCNRR